ncbi:CsbD family protein [Mycolicibacterium stellerae]|uniref:CsbD family protein n=1 Tax=Mycolicibacterium stellerae TaxID=2358193 RepID=UPI000F0B0C69|nr:CsbD family protein [Mycolicibacterium stellerae]
MSEQDKAGQARKGLIDSVKGKAKEVVGAITGNDSLTAEGQLEQTQARDRKDANSVEALADAEAEQARAEVSKAREEGAQERAAVNDETRAAEYNVRNDQAAQKRAAEQAAQQAAEQAKMRAELDAQLEVQQAKEAERQEIDAATEEAVDAAAEHQSAVQVSESAKEEADRIRRQAATLTKQADLP